jgi:hypothetical protein
MSDNVALFPDIHPDSGKRDNRGGGDNNGSGTPPGGSNVEARVATLEKLSTDIQLRMVRIETRLESVESNMATHSDIANLKTDMANHQTSLIKWFIATSFAMTGVATTIAFGLARLLK